MTERRLPLALGNSGTSSDADQNDIIQKGANNLWVTRGPNEIVIAGRFLVRTVYTTAVTGLTHNLNARTLKFRVYGQGGGGGGGGADGSGGGTAAVGGAGMSGAYFDHIFTVNPSFMSFTYDVGAGGAGGNGTGPTGGGTGLPTFVTYNAVTVGGNGGGGGDGFTAIGTLFFARAESVTGGTVVGSPDIGIAGQPGTVGIVLSINQVTPGAGGSSVLARGAPGIQQVSGVATNGLPGVFGGGGSGAAVGDTTAEPDGGAGGVGILIVDEYS